MNTETTTSSPINVNDKVLIEKGCRALGITKGATAVVKAITPLGADYSHSVRVTLYFLNSFMSGKTVSLYARHVNRLSDTFVSMHTGRPEHRIEIKRSR
jgi:hypothetical protein